MEEEGREGPTGLKGGEKKCEKKKKKHQVDLHLERPLCKTEPKASRIAKKNLHGGGRRTNHAEKIRRRGKGVLAQEGDLPP